MSTESPIVREEESKSRTSRKNKSGLTLTLNRDEFLRDLFKFHESRG